MTAGGCTVLVTGASGFIGRHVVRACLARGWRVVGVDRNPARVPPHPSYEHRVHAIDAAAPLPDLGGTRIDAAALLAWPIDPARYLESPGNLEAMAATLAAARALLEAGCRNLVATGTCAEYAPPVGDLPLGPDHPVLPTTLYAACKAAVHGVLSQLCRQHGAVCTWARLFNTFGPGEPPARLLPSIVRAIAAGGDFATGSGSQVRDYVHVQDIAEALVICLEGRVPGAVNVSTGRGVRLSEVMEAAAAACGGTGLVRLGAKPDRAWDPPRLVGDPGSLHAAGWSARDPLALIPGYARDLLAAMRGGAG